MSKQASKELEVFPNPKPSRDYTIYIESPEFTCLCPKTGQPDFATLKLEYIPDAFCVELKSWKIYLWSYRNEGGFHEDLTNKILDDLVELLNPRYIRLTADFNVRGGIYTTITAEHQSPDWQRKD
ncbi:MAG: NADPH-dependent 7-cyano-7-deazaguanine reductase QueF [Proteobacteria bacterium]|nr:NADPH-dependent 7-cyano-7-deazaguanine reductase QueF [Pseudomonadota bacterium]